jgi:NitT/TauT family transport system substrate-binding protein
MRRRQAVIGIAAAAALAVRPARAQTPVKMRVGIGFIESHAQGYYAADMGFFRRNGLDVELHQLQLGAVVAEGVASGELEAGQANLFSILAGRQHGIPFVIIAPSSLIDINDPPHDLLVSAKGSPYKTAKDLNGQTVGVFSIGGAQQMFVSNYVDKNGGDSTTLKFLPVSPSAMVPTLLQGRVVAVDLSDPQLSASRDEIQVIGNEFAAIAPRFLEGAWFTSTPWLAKNKDAARRFADAIIAAGQWSMKNQEAAAKILAKYTKVTEERAKVPFGTTLDPALVQPICDTAARYKMLQPMKATDVIWDGK